MPEYPEMEHYRERLSTLLGGQRIAGATVNRAASVNEPADRFESALVGRAVLYVERRGKHLLFHLDDGRRLVLHLMLGGWLFYGEHGPRPDSYFQVILAFGNGHSLYFGGLRLGYLHLLTAKAALERMKELGPEPFDPRLTPEAFRELLRKKRSKLKTALTDQRFLAGIGNCYSDEICFDAKLHPALQANSLDEEQAGRLYRSIRKVLTEAKEAGGYMDRPLTEGDGTTGGYDERCKVYDREGEPCEACGTPIRFESTAGRKMFYCPLCQPPA
ncbi:bifunctional DNA-formamidopyrimidine glycosylase/DNA-(apurinic or apyrimidinic site) lyase [Paenibacillaceae bacterium WGS1546]|uniref:bifunctional DNA-formamidopyrimidine glycosylase/DNA-(apurinic or apyrimidinic site) lyase n=1 Tax=Cohnella sp. WGS1546 TaxID=3366810 RepID=UPI00372D8554